jgi:hypothetical protein
MRASAASLLAGVIGALTLSLAGPVLAQSAWDHVARVVVFGDLHGDYAKFHDMLVKAGLIDTRDRWAGGVTHLVQVGDVPDRAPDTRRIVDLLMRLEPQARRAGGYVHALIGDHEAMNMEGDLRYTTPGEFAAFATDRSARVRDAYYAAVVSWLKAHPPSDGLPKFDDAYRARFDAEHPLGWVEHQAAWSTEGAYGRWVLGHSAIIRIDDTLYMHGGLGPEFAAFDVEVMNQAVIAALRHKPEVAGGPHDILWNQQGPLWYRGFAQHEEAAEAANVAALLARHQVRHIVIGHTKQYTMVNSRFAGAVILTDIAPPLGCPEPHAFLVKEADTLSAVHRGEKLALGVAGAAHDAYVAEIARLDRAAGCSMSAPATAPPPPANAAAPR